MNKWTVQVFGKCGSDSWEISVVRLDNVHGKKSWGWFDDSKLLISHNGGPCHWPISRFVFNEQVKLATEVCRRMNNGESVDA